MKKWPGSALTVQNIPTDNRRKRDMPEKSDISLFLKVETPRGASSLFPAHTPNMIQFHESNAVLSFYLTTIFLPPWI